MADAKGMGLAGTILTQIAGGAGAATLDRMKPEWTLNVGGQHTGFGLPDPDPASVQITPGALASVGLLVGLALVGKGPAPVRAALANLAGGALVVEGVKLAESEIIPRIQGQQPGVLPPGAVATKGLPQRMAGMGYAYMNRGNPYGHYQIQSALAPYGR